MTYAQHTPRSDGAIALMTAAGRHLQIHRESLSEPAWRTGR
jgi:hypothetical protein